MVHDPGEREGVTSGGSDGPKLRILGQVVHGWGGEGIDLTTLDHELLIPRPWTVDLSVSTP